MRKRKPAPYCPYCGKSCRLFTRSDGVRIGKRCWRESHTGRSLLEKKPNLAVLRSDTR